MVEIYHFVLTTSLYATVVGLILLLIKSLVRDRLNAQWHYIIWVVLIIKLIIPYGPESGLSLFNAMPTLPQQSGAVTLPAVEQPYQPIGEGQNTIPAGSPVLYESQPVAGSTGRLNVGLVVWLSGSVLVFVWLSVTYVSLAIALRKAPAFTDERILRILAACKARMGIHASVSLVLQNAVAAPSLIGVIRPMILLPADAESISDKELEYIFLHELAHLKRRDLLVSYLLLAFHVIHWFNPVLWYCFKRVRDDMEVATDEYVLSSLNSTEHRAYGLTLLTLLDRFTAAGLAPRLLGMANDKKNMQRRVKMIAMASRLRHKRTRMLLAGIVSFAVLGTVLLTNGLTGLNPDQNPGQGPAFYNADVLYRYRTQYVGDSSKVSNLIQQLPYAEFRRDMSLKTGSQPYGITVNYDFNDFNPVALTLRQNAAVMFALIGNVEEITFNLRGRMGEQTHFYTRSDVLENGAILPDSYAVSLDDFRSFLQSLTFHVFVFPDTYTPTLSHIPGIRITPAYEGSFSGLRYSTINGELFTWDLATGTISERRKSVSFDRLVPVYWSPPIYQSPSEQAAALGEDTITVAFLDEEGEVIVGTEIKITSDGSAHYTVNPSQHVRIETPLPTNLDDAVSAVLRSQGGNYYQGEVLTVGYQLLEAHEVNSTVTVFAVTSTGWFGFKNGIFTKVSGSGAIPTVITFTRDINGQYTLRSYRQPLDGGEYMASLRDMFPEYLLDDLQSVNYRDLAQQLEAQAAAYLESIGRDAPVTVEYVESALPDIDVRASNRLFSEMTKYSRELAAFPYWLGTQETIESGIRYIYETSQSKTADGYDLITFRKTTPEGTVVAQYRYKIVGSEPQLLP